MGWWPRGAAQGGPGWHVGPEAGVTASKLCPEPLGEDTAPVSKAGSEGVAGLETQGPQSSFLSEAKEPPGSSGNSLNSLHRTGSGMTAPPVPIPDP